MPAAIKSLAAHLGDGDASAWRVACAKQVTNLVLRHVWNYAINLVERRVHTCIAQPRTRRGPVFSNAS